MLLQLAHWKTKGIPPEVPLSQNVKVAGLHDIVESSNRMTIACMSLDKWSLSHIPQNANHRMHVTWQMVHKRWLTVCHQASSSVWKSSNLKHQFHRVWAVLWGYKLNVVILAAAESSCCNLRSDHTKYPIPPLSNRQGGLGGKKRLGSALKLQALSTNDYTKIVLPCHLIS